MSGGWGGRLLGAIKAGVNTYIATEPSIKTYQGLCDLANEYATNRIHYNISKSGSEKFCPFNNSLDLCFTSPPYFDLEQYADESTQSYMKYSNKSEWINGFLKQTFKNCYYALKSEKHMIINIADVKGKHNLNLEKETIRVAEEIGFKHVDTLKLALSNVNMRNKLEKYKYEPIFVFQK
jgi:DNA modification methylase